MKSVKVGRSVCGIRKWHTFRYYKTQIYHANEFDHQKKVKQKKNVAKSAKIQVILGGVLPPIMNYVVLNRRRNKKRQVLRWIALRKNFARLVFSLYLMEFLLSNAADGMEEKEDDDL